MKLENLIKIVSDITGVDIRSNSRDSDHVVARAMYYDIAYNKLRLGSLSSIGRSIGKNHATVLHSINNVFPHIKRYYKHQYIQYKNILKHISIYENFDASEDLEYRLEEITDKYNELLFKYEELTNGIDNDSQDERSEMIKSIRRLPSEKLTTLKIRLDAILRMI